jgi:hypothetical protein
MSEASDQSSEGSGRAQLPPPRFDGKVVRGKGGWLFLDSDTNSVMRQQCGELLFTPQQLDQWRTTLEKRFAWVESRGASYHFLVAPNPQSVYPEKLPFEVPPGVQRPVTQLINYLDQRHSRAKLLYPIEGMLERRDRRIYAQTNTHWTDLGAFVAYEALMDDMPKTNVGRRLTASDVRFTEVMHAGDLGCKVVPPEESLHVHGAVIESKAHVTDDNRVYTNGHRIDYECPAAEEGTCLFLGDSFTHAMLPFLAESFRRMVFAHISILDGELVESISPDSVVSVMNERFLIRVPKDSGGKTLKQWIVEKRAMGKVYPPRSKGGTRVDTPSPL